MWEMFYIVSSLFIFSFQINVQRLKKKCQEDIKTVQVEINLNEKKTEEKKCTIL